jgi:hypothetical protein
MKRSRIKNRGRKAAARLKSRRKFREAVLKRSGHVCDRCGEYNLACHAHHFRPVSLGGKDNPKLPTALFNIVPSRLRGQCATDGNGVCLCPRCHGETHERRGSAVLWIDSHNRSLDMK